MIIRQNWNSTEWIFEDGTKKSIFEVSVLELLRIEHFLDTLLRNEDKKNKPESMKDSFRLMIARSNLATAIYFRRKLIIDELASTNARSQQITED